MGAFLNDVATCIITMCEASIVCQKSHLSYCIYANLSRFPDSTCPLMYVTQPLFNDRMQQEISNLKGNRCGKSKTVRNFRPRSKRCKLGSKVAEVAITSLQHAYSSNV